MDPLVAIPPVVQMVTHGPELAVVEPDDGKHKCPYLPCERRVPPHLFACRAHWMKVPAPLRAELYAAYDGRSERPYHEVRAECVEEMNKR